MLPNGWIYDDDQEEITDILNEVSKLNIVEVLEAYGVRPEHRNGTYVKALCPFHLDNKLGSFVINTERNTCYCYSCAKGGGVIKSASIILDKSYSDAALQVAADKGIIDEKKYKKLAGVKYKPIAKEFTPYDEKPVEENPTTRNLKDSVYKDLQFFFDLSEDHKNYLIEKRKLSEDDLRNYFSFDTEDKTKKRELLKYISKKYEANIETIGTKVPGFYFNNNKLDVIPKKGIGMFLKSPRGIVTAVQVRADENKEDVPRYTYFSYKPPKSFSNMTGGSSAGTCFDTIYSKNESKKLAIVEGKFKAEILAQNGFNVIAVQGVNNFSRIETQIRETERVLKTTFEKVTIFYDADFISNPQVTAATIKLFEYLRKKEFEFDIQVAYWNPEDGKGIDDLIINGNKKTVKLMPADEYSAISQTSFTQALFTTGFDSTPANKISKDDRTAILNEFKSIMCRKFNIVK